MEPLVVLAIGLVITGALTIIGVKLADSFEKERLGKTGGCV